MDMTYEIRDADGGVAKEVVVYKDGVEYGRLLPQTLWYWKSDAEFTLPPLVIKDESQLEEKVAGIKELHDAIGGLKEIVAKAKSGDDPVSSVTKQALNRIVGEFAS